MRDQARKRLDLGKGLTVLREEKQLGEIAAAHGISPNQLRNWKREFMENAARIFNESKREKDIRAKEKELEAERAELLSTIGQLAMERDWLKKISYASEKGYGLMDGRLCSWL